MGISVSPYRLAIDGLAPQLSALDWGNVYLLSSPMQPLLLQYLAVDSLGRILRHGGCAVLLSATPIRQWLTLAQQRGWDLDAAIQQQRLQCLMQTADYVHKLKKYSLQRLLDELDSCNLPEHSVLLVTPGDALLHWQTQAHARRQLNTWQHWLMARQISLVALHLPLNAAQHSLLCSVQPSLGGMAVLVEDDKLLSWSVAWWRNAQGSMGEQSVSLTADREQHLFVSLTAQGEALPYDTLLPPDENQVFATQSSLSGEKGIPKDWQIVEDLEQLLRATAQAIAACVIIEAGDAISFEQHLRVVHQLRLQRGRRLKIIVRERQGHLRYHQEWALLALGANLIMHLNVAFSRLFNFIAALHGQRFGGEIINDFDTAVASASPVTLSGYLTPLSFCEATLKVVDRSRLIKLEHALIHMPLLENVAHIDALKACVIKRPGDMISADNQSLYLFLFACRESDVDIALSHMFKQPLADYFEEQYRYFDIDRIREVLSDLQQRTQQHNFTDFSALLPQQLVPKTEQHSIAGARLKPLSASPEKPAEAPQPQLPRISAFKTPPREVMPCALKTK